MGFYSTQVLGKGEVTVGQSKNDDGSWPYADTAQAIEKMGAKHVDTSVDISCGYYYAI